MARLHLLHFPSTAYSLQTQPLFLSSSSSSSCLYNNSKLHSHLPACSISSSHSLSNPLFPTSLPTRHPHSVVANVASQAEPEVSESKSGEGGGGGAREEEFSTTRLLASNIPWTWTPEDVRALFEKFGTVSDIELSMYNQTKNRGLAFVSMGSPEEALAAFDGLELKEIEGRVLKMNWAKLRKEKPPSPPQLKGLMFSLFVANLPYDASNKDLKEFFISEGANAESAEVIYEENPRKPAGYGFVRFKSRKQAEEAHIAFEGKEFNGRPLRVSRAKPFARKQKDENQQSDDTPVESSSVTEQADSPDGN